MKLLSLAPVVVLGAAIGWPESLGKPAAEQLAAIAAKPDAVALGYGIYLLYSVLIAPLMIALAARLAGGLNSVPGATVDIETPVALAVSVLSLWMLLTGVWLMRRGFSSLATDSPTPLPRS
ncbi:MAG: hypothetical protein ABIR94_10500 [Rubrivivax sp.]